MRTNLAAEPVRAAAYKLYYPNLWEDQAMTESKDILEGSRQIRELLIKALIVATGASEDEIREAPLTISLKFREGLKNGRSDLEDRILEYANDLRRNSSGGDDYPWEYAKGTADYLEILISRSTAVDPDFREVDEAVDGGEAIPDREGLDGTDRLCQVLYGRKATAKDYLGGSDARMLHEAADRLAAQPASPLRGREEAIEECAQIAAQHYWCGGGAIVCSDVIAAKIRALLSAAPPEQPAAQIGENRALAKALDAAIHLINRYRTVASDIQFEQVLDAENDFGLALDELPDEPPEQPAAAPAADAIFDLCVMIVEEECYLDDPAANGPIFKTGLAIRDRIKCAQRNPDPAPEKKALDGETGV